MKSAEEYRADYPKIASLLHDTDLTYLQVAERFKVTKQWIAWLNQQLGPYGRPPKSVLAARRKLAEAQDRLRRLGDES